MKELSVRNGNIYKNTRTLSIKVAAQDWHQFSVFNFSLDGASLFLVTNGRRGHHQGRRTHAPLVPVAFFFFCHEELSFCFKGQSLLEWAHRLPWHQKYARRMTTNVFFFLLLIFSPWERSLNNIATDDCYEVLNVDSESSVWSIRYTFQWSFQYSGAWRSIDEFRMVLSGQPMPCFFFFTKEFAKSNFLPCRSSTIMRLCEACPMG